MARYLNEHDRHLASLTTAHYDEQEHARALAKHLDHLEQALHGSGDARDHAAQDAAVTSTTQELDGSGRVSDEKNTGAEAQTRRK